MRAHALLPVLLLAIGCESSTAPLRGDIYVLLSIAGDPLPAPYAVNQVSDHRIIADTLSLAPDLKGVRRTVYDDDALPGGFHLVESEFNWLQTGDRISIAFVCNDTADCIGGPHLVGTKDATSLTIDYSVLSTQPLLYAKVDRSD